MRVRILAAAAVLASALACTGGDGAPAPTSAPTTVAPTSAAPTSVAPTDPVRADVETALRRAAIAAHAYRADKGQFPDDVAPLAAYGYRPVAGVTVTTTRPGCFEGRTGPVTLYLDATDGSVSERLCPIRDPHL